MDIVSCSTVYYIRETCAPCKSTGIVCTFNFDVSRLMIHAYESASKADLPVCVYMKRFT